MMIVEYKLVEIITVHSGGNVSIRHYRYNTISLMAYMYININVNLFSGFDFIKVKKRPKSINQNYNICKIVSIILLVAMTF